MFRAILKILFDDGVICLPWCIREKRCGSVRSRRLQIQWKQDQTVGIQYSEEAGQRSAGLQVWDRSDTQRLSELIEKLNAANAIQDPAARAAAIQTARAGAQPGPQRLFAGKGRDRAATVSLSDASGKVRLTLKVQADGTASIEFLDAEGKVTERLPK
jgi:hypothetical protein